MRGRRVAVLLAAALLEYARDKPYCYPTTARLAADLGVCQNTVRAALHALVRADWIRIVLGADQPNGRRIWLCWLEPGTPANAPTRDPRRAVPQVSDPLQPVGAPLQPVVVPLQLVAAPLQPAAAKCRTLEELNERNVVVSPTQIPDASALPLLCPTPAPALPAAPTLTPIPAPVAVTPTVPVPAPTPTLPTSVGTQPPTPAEPLLDELKALGPTTPPDQVRRLAARLCAALHDPGSLGGYITAIGKVVAGTLSREKLIVAVKAGLKAVGKARSAGAIFMWTLANYMSPPKPSEVRYYQTRTTPLDAMPAVPTTSPRPTRKVMGSPGGVVQCMAGALQGVAAHASAGTSAAAPEPEPTAENLADLRAMAADRRHPLRHVARRRLGEIAADKNHPLREVANRLVAELGPE